MSKLKTAWKIFFILVLFLFSSKAVFADDVAFYFINPVKNPAGEVLHQVKIYVDNNYTHRWVTDKVGKQETLTFCSGCHCDEDKLVDCEFGTHTIKLEKNGYLDWEETENISPGYSSIIDPVMAVPTPTPTVTPPIQKAIYKINVIKDNGNNPLSGVNIFVDGNDTHHEDDEILEFCSGCHCDIYNNVDCEFGEHTIRLSKNGYADWSEIKNLISGSSFEVNPVMSANSPTTTPLPAATSAPVPPTATTIPTLTRTPTLTLSLTLMPPSTSSAEAEILGATSSGEVEISGMPAEAPVSATKNKKKGIFRFLPFLLIIPGAGMIGFAVFSFLKSKGRL